MSKKNNKSFKKTTTATASNKATTTNVVAKKTSFDATAMTPKSSPLKSQATPRVFFTPTAWHTVDLIVAYCQKEVGWFGLVDRVGSDYLITEIFVPTQIVSGVTTDIEPEDHSALIMELLRDNKDVSKLLYWGHSHVNMGVSPSGTDEEQLEEYLSGMDTSEFFLRGIHNKRGDVKMDVFDVKNNMLHQKVAVSPWVEPLTSEQVEGVKKMIDENVSEKTFIQKQSPPKGVVSMYNPYTGYMDTGVEVYDANAKAEEEEEEEEGAYTGYSFEWPDDEALAWAISETFNISATWAETMVMNNMDIETVMEEVLNATDKEIESVFSLAQAYDKDMEEKNAVS